MAEATIGVAVNLSADAVQGPQHRPDRGECACRCRGSLPSGSTSRSPSRCCSRTRPTRSRSCTSCATSACRYRWTISAPAIRRWHICGTFPFDRIKIDRSFVRDMLVRKDCRAIVRAVVGLARSLGITTIIEGIETKEQLETRADRRLRSRPGLYLQASRCPSVRSRHSLPSAERTAAAA